MTKSVNWARWSRVSAPGSAQHTGRIRLCTNKRAAPVPAHEKRPVAKPKPRPQLIVLSRRSRSGTPGWCWIGHPGRRGNHAPIEAPRGLLFESYGANEKQSSAAGFRELWRTGRKRRGSVVDSQQSPSDSDRKASSRRQRSQGTVALARICPKKPGEDSRLNSQNYDADFAQRNPMMDVRISGSA
jgi:hypothetical protein